MAVEVKAMEVKKTQQISKPAGSAETDAAVKAGQWRDFLGDIKSEFKKITWTNPEELKTYTKLVVAATFLFGMGIYVMDLAIQTVLNVLGFMMRLIGG
jgi:preprotein translocase subunit SecE